MFRFTWRFLVVTALAAAVAVGLVLERSPDWLYTVQEWLNYSRFRRFDGTIESAARKYGVDAMLIKAIIWRESSFHPEMVGKDGERGLMQVTVAAANDWAKAKRIETFVPTDLFDPHTNIEVGAWYLKQALQRWSSKDDPLPFALAEYNAGRRRVDRWIEDTNMGGQATADDLRGSIGFPSTRNYVDAILARYRFYKARGRM